MVAQKDERIQHALVELQDIIGTAFPGAVFEIYPDSDPDGMYLEAMVDVEDLNDMLDVFIDRLVDMQIEERLPVYVVPVRTPERVARLVAEATRRREQTAASK